jgi:hypothetical protein
MAVQYVTGPVPVYISIPPRTMMNSATGLFPALTYPSAGDIRFLGYSDRTIKIGQGVVYEPAMADPAGQANPYDQVYQGQSAQVAMTLSVFNEAVLVELDEVVAFTAKTRGKDVRGDIASLMLMEGQTFHVWLDFTYARLKGFGALYNMPRGYHYTACNMLGWEIMAGTTTEKRGFSFQAIPVYNASDGTFLLYDATFTNIPDPSTTLPPVVASGALS